MLQKQPKDSVINLSNQDIPKDIVEIMSLGMNTHMRQRLDNYKRKAAVEKLYSDIKRERSSHNVFIDNEETLKAELKVFGLRNRVDHSRDLLSKEQYAAIREFVNKPDIIIRKADKSNVFVIMDTTYYQEKIAEILGDESKFMKIENDPTVELKRKLNKHIGIVNAVNDDIKLTKLVGHFDPAYLYANPKIHKRIINPPLRPIVSQIGTPTASVAAELNHIITRYMPNKYMVKSTNEFMSLVKGADLPSGSTLASLDVENLFTNVPVEKTIDIIMNNVYNHKSLKPPNIPKITMKEMLTLCTTGTPFRNINGDLFLQVDGVMMGSSLGPTFANYYMAHLEETVFEDHPEIAPLIYARYVDDIFVVIENIEQLHVIRDIFEANSVLKFTFEEQRDNQLVFLDVLLNNKNGPIETSVHTKKTSTGDCINYNGICPEKYKVSTIKTFLHRAYNISSNWQLFHHEVEKIKQRLVNNNFPMKIIDRTIEEFINKKFPNTAEKPINCNLIKFYYESQMWSNYKIEEKQLKDLLLKHVKPVNENDILELNIFYRIRKLKSFFIKNNPHKRNSEFNVVYQYTCNEGECNSQQYIGYTEQTLEDRFRQHQSVIKHLREAHNVTKRKPSEILKSVEVLYRGSGRQELLVMEALMIAEKKPLLNNQEEGRDRILQIF